MTKPRLVDLFPDDARELLQIRGRDLLAKLGLPAVRSVVTEVLSGHNVRNATEKLTRRRLGALNSALFVMYLRGAREFPDFLRTLPERARAEFLGRTVTSADRTILLWMLGLTGKQVQNVLRADSQAWDDYIRVFKTGVQDSADEATVAYGRLSGELKMGRDGRADISWPWILYFLAAIGSQTLGVRGSEKSMYGKLFEKLVLAAVLHVLGFELVEENEVRAGGFWLSSRGKKRESDATAIVKLGVGIRFDLGFIGPGNTEISLDKVSRFERAIEISTEKLFMHTYIIVDRIGRRSRIIELAKAISGTIVQMSTSYWPRTLGDAISQSVPGYKSPLAGMDDPDVRKAIERRIKTAPFERIFMYAADSVAEEEASYGDVDDSESVE